MRWRRLTVWGLGVIAIAIICLWIASARWSLRRSWARNLDGPRIAHRVSMLGIENGDAFYTFSTYPVRRKDVTVYTAKPYVARRRDFGFEWDRKPGMSTRVRGLGFDYTWMGAASSPTMPRPLAGCIVPLYMPLLLVTSVAARLWWVDRRQRQGSKNGHCHRCGYDLRATPDRCPECGEATMPESSTPLDTP
jgi:hypothetical protein